VRDGSGNPIYARIRVRYPVLIAIKFAIETTRKYQEQTLEVRSFAWEKTIKFRILPILPMAYNGQKTYRANCSSTFEKTAVNDDTLGIISVMLLE
jgi:hypothetical protein